MTYQLYYAPDNASLAVRLVLEELGAGYQTVLVDRSSKAQKSDAYLAMNPQGLIPVLVTEQGPISETAAILLWLADKHGAMAPELDSSQRPAFLKWLFYLSNSLHADLLHVFYPERYVDAASTVQDRYFAVMSQRVITHLQHLDQLCVVGHAWLNPLAPSVVDYYMAACLRFAVLYPESRSGWLSPESFANLYAHVRLLEDRPAVVAAIAAEGLGSRPFSCPSYARPPEGTAT